MDRRPLGKALGAIASYAVTRDVQAVRVVFCDAEAHDNGWMHPLDIAGRVRIRGRGGTVLQPGIDLLQDAPDFPNDGPILVITDAWIDRVRIKRDHAFLIPACTNAALSAATTRSRSAWAALMRPWAAASPSSDPVITGTPWPLDPVKSVTRLLPEGQPRS